MLSGKVHPQSKVFQLLFPLFSAQLDTRCVLATLVKESWLASCYLHEAVAFKGLCGDTPSFTPADVERGGVDYTCRLSAHFESQGTSGGIFQISLGNFPIPDENGEFIIGGNRYYVPMFLRHGAPGKRLEKFKRVFPHLDILKKWADTGQSNGERWRDPDNLYVLLLDDLLLAIYGISPRIQRAIGRIDPAELADDPDRTLRRRLSRMLYVGRHTFVHDFIIGGPGRRGYGKLVDTTNPLARLCQRGEVSFYGPCGGIHPESVGEYYLRDVHDNDLCRICPVEAAQGHTVGLRLNLARQADVSVETRRIVSPEDSDFGDSLGHAASLIPFVEHNDVNRALMGANMLKQAVPLAEPDIPWIQTGWEKVVAEKENVDSSCKSGDVLALGKNLFTAYMPWGLETFEDGIVISESASKSLTTKQEKVFWFEHRLPTWRKKDNWKMEVTSDNPTFLGSNTEHLDERGIVRIGSHVKTGDVLVSAVLKKYADVGKTQILDMLVSSILSSKPEKVEDASFYVEKFKGKVTQVIDSAKNKGFFLPSGVRRRIGITIMSSRPAKVGDKIAGRHGNKGVIVKVYPDHEMPYIKTAEPHCADEHCPISGAHRHAQVVLNPLGVIGRLNLGQLFETTLAKTSEVKNAPIIARSFENSWTVDAVAAELKSCGFAEDGKEQFFVYQDGFEVPLQFRSLAGPQYIIRLPHISEDKIMGRGSPGQFAYSQRDNQPHRGKRYVRGSIIHGGQRIGEMETWALAGHAAWNILDDLFNFKSDDLLRRKGNPGEVLGEDGSRRPQAFINLILLMRAMGLNLALTDEKGDEVTPNHIEKQTGAHYTKVALALPKPGTMDKWDLVSELTLDDFSAVPGLSTNKEKRSFIKPWQMQYIDFPFPVVHPLLAETIWEIFHFPQKLEEHISKVKAEGGALSVWAASLADSLDGAEDWPMLMEPEDGALKGRYMRLDRVLDRLKVAGLKPKDVLLNRLPAVPRSFYVGQLQFGGELVRLYRNVLYFNGRLAGMLKEEAPLNEIIQNERQRLQLSLSKLFGIRRQKGLLGILHGKTGLVRGHLAGKRADFSGRAVIVGAPDLGLDAAGLPTTLWEKLFPDVEKDQSPIMLLNRQPSLHRYSFQAFHAVHHDQGDVVRLNPFVCAPFNADFDGDTIAVHAPRTPQAKLEAERLFPSRNLLSQASGGLVLGFDRDLALAASLMTYSPTTNTDDDVPHLGEDGWPESGEPWWAIRMVDGLETTAGRLQLRKALGPKVSLPNRTLNKAEWIRCVVLVARTTPERLPVFTREISKIFTRSLKISGLSASLADFDTYRASTYEPDTKPNFLWFAAQAGRYSEDLERQITSGRGFMRRPQEMVTENETEDVKPAVEVKSCLLGGHPEKDYLLSAHGARSGLVDRGLSTSYSGHLMRDWVMRVQHLRIVEEDCGVQGGLPVAALDLSLVKGKRFDQEGNIINSGDAFQFRSPVTCQAKDEQEHSGICQKCYGLDPSTGEAPVLGLPVGILAAQALAERVSQLTMRTFHTGGAQTSSADNDEKSGLDLVRALRKTLRKQSKDQLGKLNSMLSNFPKGGRPDMVHFEVLLRGFSEKIETGLLVALFKSQSLNLLLKLALSGATDDISTVLSRLATGKIAQQIPGN